MSRRINWGADATDAKYRTEDTGTPGDFVVAEDTDGNTVLLQYDDTAGEWVYGGPVNMAGSDISNVGQLSSTSVSTDKISANEETLVEVVKTTDQDTTTNLTAVDWDTEREDNLSEFDFSINEFSPSKDGYYTIIAQVGFDTATDGDSLRVQFRDVTNGNEVGFASTTAGAATLTTVNSVTYTTLSSTNNYQLQARNTDSSDTITGADYITYMSIIKGVVQ